MRSSPFTIVDCSYVLQHHCLWQYRITVSYTHLDVYKRQKQLSKEKQLSLEKMEEIMSEVKKGEITRVAFTNEQLHKYFPNSYTPAMMKREILEMCIRDSNRSMQYTVWSFASCFLRNFHSTELLAGERSCKSNSGEPEPSIV